MCENCSSERLQALQNEILEAIARGEALRAIMQRLCLRAEAIAPGVICSVVTVDSDNRLIALAAPSLPDAYAAAVTGVPAGPRVGSCGTAIFRGEPVCVTDIATDPLWQGFTHLVLPLGLRACWSSPINARDGRVVGSFAFYYDHPRGPDAIERQIVATCLHLCAIAIEHEEVRARNHRLAYFDTLTGLPNRASFNESITQMNAGVTTDFGLMLIDIDHLKVINDTMGHAAGDALIATVAARIQAVVGQATAFRIGGDEFAVLLPKGSRAADMRLVASAIIAGMARPLDHDGNGIMPSVTIGAALADEQRGDTVKLRQDADFALYHAKETRRGGYVRFREGLRSSMIRRLQTKRDVAEALTEGRVIAHYQPVVRIDTGEIVGLEALARMRMPDGRIASAGEFQEALGDPKVAYRLTGQMLGAVAGDIAAWKRAGLDIQHVGLNVTAADFEKGDLVQRIVKALERVGVPPRNLVIEITEQVFMGGRKDGVARTIAALREHGICVALDDFGTGFASLTHLLDFPVDIIKIDRSFIAAAQSSAKSSVIVEAMVRIANRLDMKIIAEGIETQAQADWLRAKGGRLGQGFLYAPAMPAGLVGELLQRLGRKPDRPLAALQGVTASAA
ncbi:bifunctional diguanylate cyclase/phosphodiesterase [Bosea sp. (in: a-proteobacteria)]|uniref:putative bifunctional diguanylate cyclase/phosphodiesterase n=1 Tax=Bosea sp. (in: a-proteobacteria) TaxID=1871050 RepID=UPI002733D487|nr:EAL domain-containing protein [Bosea sp. (in: a-proteobacteria)]MDP3407834.1 EAL domain-containing protein [Bosea sp. (in: a-proteobacteria)]